MAIIGFLIFGLFLGFIARAILPGRQHIGLIPTLLLGVAGSIIGGIIANLLGTGNIFELNFIGFVGALIASVALLAIGERAGLGAGPKRGELRR